MKINYKKIGDYLLPLLKTKSNKNKQIGKYGLLKLNYIKKNKKYLYTKLLMNGTLNNYLYEINLKCEKDLKYYINHFKTIENITEELKENNEIEWVNKMNNIKNRAEEIIINFNIYD